MLSSNQHISENRTALGFSYRPCMILAEYIVGETLTMGPYRSSSSLLRSSFVIQVLFTCTLLYIFNVTCICTYVHASTIFIYFVNICAGSTSYYFKALHIKNKSNIIIIKIYNILHICLYMYIPKDMSNTAGNLPSTTFPQYLPLYNTLYLFSFAYYRFICNDFKYRNFDN